VYIGTDHKNASARALRATAAGPPSTAAGPVQRSSRWRPQHAQQRLARAIRAIQQRPSGMVEEGVGAQQQRPLMLIRAARGCFGRCSGLIGMPFELSHVSCALSLLLYSSSGNATRVKIMELEGRLRRVRRAAAACNGASPESQKRGSLGKGARSTFYLLALVGGKAAGCAKPVTA
jgi:hypothetical protein